MLHRILLIIAMDITIFMIRKLKDQRMITPEPQELLEHLRNIMLRMGTQDMPLTKEEMIIILNNTTQQSQSTTQIWISFKKLPKTSSDLVLWQEPIKEKEVN